MAIPHFIREALDRAPEASIDDIDPDELAEVRRHAADVRAGRVQTIEHAEVQRAIRGRPTGDHGFG